MRFVIALSVTLIGVCLGGSVPSAAHTCTPHKTFRSKHLCEPNHKVPWVPGFDVGNPCATAGNALQRSLARNKNGPTGKKGPGLRNWDTGVNTVFIG